MGGKHPKIVRLGYGGEKIEIRLASTTETTTLGDVVKIFCDLMKQETRITMEPQQFMIKISRGPYLFKRYRLWDYWDQADNFQIGYSLQELKDAQAIAAVQQSDNQDQSTTVGENDKDMPKPPQIPQLSRIPNILPEPPAPPKI